MIKDDGDIPRAVGLATINAAHLEGRVDDLLFYMLRIEQYSELEQRWPISQKLRKLKKIFSSIDHDTAKQLTEDIELCEGHFEWRNEIVHGRIYSPEYHVENLVSGRPNVPDREASSEEIYTLANNLDELNARLYRPLIFQLDSMLKELELRGT